MMNTAVAEVTAVVVMVAEAMKKHTKVHQNG